MLLVENNDYTIKKDGVHKDKKTVYMTLDYALYRCSILDRPEKRTEKDKQLSMSLISDKSINTICVCVSEDKLHNMDTETVIDIVSKIHRYLDVLLIYKNIQIAQFITFNESKIETGIVLQLLK